MSPVEPHSAIPPNRQIPRRGERRRLQPLPPPPPPPPTSAPWPLPRSSVAGLSSAPALSLFPRRRPTPPPPTSASKSAPLGRRRRGAGGTGGGGGGGGVRVVVGGLVVPPATSVHELLECPVCTNSMYPPIHQRTG
uniref:Uncharacterized protein n=1 Tax=Oryza glumipatula TaxID=40148 RepID=A0A0D9YA04_9ORYZ